MSLPSLVGRGKLAVPFLLLLAVLAFFYRLAFSDLILARGDVLLYFYPYWQAASDALRAGRLPLWNPDLFMGAPLLANSQMGFFYPLNWPLWAALPVPYAVNAAILLHLWLAGLGAYLAGRRALGLERPAALLVGLLYALGGYVTAQVEHVNQVQGLAWLPFFLAVLGPPAERGTGRRRALLVGLLFALQLLAGHTQTAFISGVGLGVWLLVATPGRERGQRWPAWGSLVAGSLAALLLAGVQLLPTLELARLSSRQGGLPFNEVVSFSLHPLLLGQALLPAYGQSLFSEYVAFLPLAALALAAGGAAYAWRAERWRSPAFPALAVALFGLALALGLFNPVYWLLGRLPGFNLFRVPARWLAWYALGSALLAGYGWQHLAAWWGRGRPGRGRRGRGRPGRGRPGWLALPALLMASFAASVPLSRLLPLGQEVAVAGPAGGTLVMWGVELGLLLLAWGWLRPAAGAQAATAALMLAVGFVASRSLPAHQLTTPAAFFDLRPPVARLQALSHCLVPGQPCPPPPARLLSLSGIQFDPGDQAELDSIYGELLPAAARYDYTVAIKEQEIVAPNLPLAYGLASVDGFDGGLLPLHSYSQLMSLILPAGERLADGRLREFLPAIPQGRWLDLFGARYLITDKVGDVWRDGVYFDRQFPQELEAGEAVTVGQVPPFAADGLWLLATGQPGRVSLTFATGEERVFTPQEEEDGLIRLAWPTPAQVRAIHLQAGAGPWQVAALSLVNGGEGTFQSLVAGPVRLVYSGDVKIYENLDVLPRAQVLGQWSAVGQMDQALATMRRPEFDPGRQVVLLGDVAPPATKAEAGPPGQARVTAYAPERVVVEAESAAPAWLLLADACYPGWQAWVDGVEATILPADGLFRGVALPAGRHEVLFRFRPLSVRLGAVLSALAWLLWLGAWFWPRRRGRT